MIAAPAQVGNNGGVNVRIAIAIAVNLLTALATYAYYGMNVAAGAVAARNTARVSAVFFALAIATRFHARFRQDYAAWMKAFVVAHVIHFGTVIIFHALLGALANPMFLGVSTGGALLLTATAVTLARAPKTHLVLTYVIWLAFMVAFSSRVARQPLPEAPLIALLSVATLIHIVSAMRRKTSVSAASA